MPSVSTSSSTSSTNGGTPSFGAMSASTYPGTLLALLVLVVVDGVTFHVLASALHGAWSVVVHATLASSHVYMLVWLLRDARLMRERTHWLDGDALHVRLGARFSGRVAYGDIVRVAVGQFERPPRDARTAGVVRVTPGDDPNVRIELARAVKIVTLFGRERVATTLDLYVDDPRALADAIAARMPSSS